MTLHYCCSCRRRLLAAVEVYSLIYEEITLQGLSCCEVFLLDIFKLYARDSGDPREQLNTRLACSVARVSYLHQARKPSLMVRRWN